MGSVSRCRLYPQTPAAAHSGSLYVTSLTPYTCWLCSQYSSPLINLYDYGVMVIDLCKRIQKYVNINSWHYGKSKVFHDHVILWGDEVYFTDSHCFTYKVWNGLLYNENNDRMMYILFINPPPLVYNCWTLFTNIIPHSQYYSNLTGLRVPGVRGRFSLFGCFW